MECSDGMQTELLRLSQVETSIVPKTYSGPIKHQTNLLWQELCGRPFFPTYKPPAKYTSELVGVQYLYKQTGQELPGLEQTRQILENDDDMEQENENQDEGFVEMEQPHNIFPEEITLPPSPTEVSQLPHPSRPILHLPTNEEYQRLANETSVEGMEMPSEVTPTPDVHVTPSEESSETSDVLGPDNVPGYDKVLLLAEFLIQLRDERALTIEKVHKLIYLWDQLSEYDKKRTKFPKRFSKKPWSGKFGGRRKHVAQGVESITKVLLGPNQGPAQWPNCNRYTEATCELLLQLYPADKKQEGRIWTRWRLVLQAYHNIRQVIVKSPLYMEKTEIQLPLLNQKTLQQWYNQKDKEQEQKILLQGLNMPKPAMTESGLPQARQKPAVLPASEAPSFEFSNPPCTAGLAHKKTSKKRKMTPASEPSISMLQPVQPIIVRYPVIMEQQKLIVLPGQSTVFTPPSETTSSTTSTTTKKIRKSYSTPEYIKCSKCGQNRKNSSSHKSYMFKIYCEVSEAISFQEWRNQIKQQMDQERKSKKKT